MNPALSALISSCSVLLGHVHGRLLHVEEEGRAGTLQNPLIKMTGPTMATINSIQPQFIPLFRVQRRDERRHAGQTLLSVSLTRGKIIRGTDGMNDTDGGLSAAHPTGYPVSGMN